jgi:hypothetical protein
MQQVQLYKTIYYGMVNLSMIARAGDVTIPAIILEEVLMEVVAPCF